MSKHLMEQGLRAAREKRAVRRYVENTTITDAYVVQTSAAIYYNIPEGKQVIVCRVHVGCETPDEFMGGYVVGCDAVAGGGNATKMHAEIHDHVGTKKEFSGHIVKDSNPYLVLKYSDGHKSVSMAVKATDAATVVSFGWNGWLEDEGTLS